MKSISWLEFLITFFIFIIVFYVLFDNLRLLILNAKTQLKYLDSFQKFLISSYYYIEFGEINKMKTLLNTLNTFLENLEYLEFMIVSTFNKNCFNCIYLYYNFSEKSINIVQTSFLAHRSRLDIKLIVNKSFYIVTNNSDTKCNKYLELDEENIIFCSINLYGNSSVKIYPSKNYILFNHIDSSLSIYDGYNFYKSPRQQKIPLYIGKSFEFYVSKEKAIIRNIFIIN